MVARYHHPGFGRFLSEDPIGSPAFGRCSAGSRDLTSSRLAEGNRRGDLKNLYAYVQNRPPCLRTLRASDKCEDEARECFGRARDALFQCRKTIFQAGVAAAASCVPICALIAPGPLFPPCFVNCAGIAAAATSVDS